MNVRYYKIPELIAKLNTKLNGMFRYYGISNNFDWLSKMCFYVSIELRKWLNKRSQKGKLSWEKFNTILKYNPLAKPKIYFSLWQ